jgi:hypothetical protein
MGRYLIRAYRHDGGFKSGDRFEAEDFDVEILTADEGGVTRIAYTFKEPLASERYTFYLSSFDCGALKLRFDRPDMVEPPALGPLPPPPASVAEFRAAVDRVLAGDPRAIEAVFAGLSATDEKVRRLSNRAVRELVGAAAVATASPAQADFDADDQMSNHVDELRRWWFAKVDPELLVDLFRDWEKRDEVRHRRDEIMRARALVGRLIETDLFLTGPPYPGLR